MSTTGHLPRRGDRANPHRGDCTGTRCPVCDCCQHCDSRIVRGVVECVDGCPTPRSCPDPSCGCKPDAATQREATR
jgi:hypothetical protein